MLRALVLFLLLVPAVLLAQADAPFTIEDIRIEGLRRISPAVVFRALPFEQGDRAGAESVRVAVRTLFETGNFDDVEIARDGDILVVRVLERPFISEILLEGNKAIADDDLYEGLGDSGLAAGQVLQRATLEGIRQELLRQYSSRGRYNASVTADLEEQPRNRVAITLNIDEGTPAKIRRINIIGATAFKKKHLLRLFESKERGGIIYFFTKRGQYSRETLFSDLERLSTFYRSRGYFRFAVDSAQVSLTEDKKAIFINISVSEGELYAISEIEYFGNLIVGRETLERFMPIRKGLLFSEDGVTAGESLITRLINNQGYLNAEVKHEAEADDDNRSVSLRFFVNPGKRTYVRRIEFSGNHHTTDEVLRRELRQLENAPASRQAIDNSRVRLERLGYFREVEVETEPVPGSVDEVDVLVEVEEEFSGSVVFSLGYNETYGVLYSLDFARDNIFGTGRRLDVRLNKNRARDSLNISFVEPYYTPEGVSRSFNVYYEDLDLRQINITRYVTQRAGVGVGFGYPLSETSRLDFGLRVEQAEIDVGAGVVQEISATPALLDVSLAGTTDPNRLRSLYFPADTDPTTTTDTLPRGPEDVMRGQLAGTTPGFLDQHGSDFLNYKLSIGWSDFRLNRGQLASRGFRQSLGAEISLPGSDLEYFRINYLGEYFRPLNNIFTLRSLVRLGYGGGYGDTESLPFFEHYFAGGLRSVRGYETSSLGPRSTPALGYLSIAENPNTAQNEVAPGVQELREGERFYIREDETDLTSPLLTRQVFLGDEPLPFGGNVLVTGLVEILFPLPFVPDQRSVQSGFFFDFGNVFNTECPSQRVNCLDFDVGDLRYSVGIGTVWLTRFGPLNFSLAFPINDKEGDDTEGFEFSIGRGFGL